MDAHINFIWIICIGAVAALQCPWDTAVCTGGLFLRDCSAVEGCVKIRPSVACVRSGCKTDIQLSSSGTKILNICKEVVVKDDAIVGKKKEMGREKDIGGEIDRKIEGLVTKACIAEDFVELLGLFLGAMVSGVLTYLLARCVRHLRSGRRERRTPGGTSTRRPFALEGATPAISPRRLSF